MPRARMMGIVSWILRKSARLEGLPAPAGYAETVSATRKGPLPSRVCSEAGKVLKRYSASSKTGCSSDQLHPDSPRQLRRVVRSQHASSVSGSRSL